MTVTQYEALCVLGCSEGYTKSFDLGLPLGPLHHLSFEGDVLPFLTSSAPFPLYDLHLYLPSSVFPRQRVLPSSVHLVRLPVLVHLGMSDTNRVSLPGHDRQSISLSSKSHWALT